MSIDTIVTAASKVVYDRFHFSQATISEGFVFCSGVIGNGADGKLPELVREEFYNAWRQVGEVLAAASAGFADIIEYTSYHVGLQQHMGDFMLVRDEYLAEPWPAWTAIGISELAVPGARVEIQVTARRPAGP